MARMILVGFAVIAAVTAAIGEVSLEVDTSSEGSCALISPNVTCWGSGNYGQNGNGATGTLYEPPSTPIDFGAGFEAHSIKCGSHSCCTVSTGKEAKCWGRNQNGQLGQGDTDNRGDSEGEMGDNLEIIDLGSGFAVDQLACGSRHTCALSTNHSIKCFGQGFYGRTGYEHQNDLGDDSGEMGDALPVVALGTDFEPVQVNCLHEATCALSIDYRVKCWGRGSVGLGGASAGTMGDNLAVIDLGADFDAVEIRCGENHACALSMNHEIKCWGNNNRGQLGLGDTTSWSATSDLGDRLPIVDLGTGFIPSALSAGDRYSISISIDGEMKAWGDNTGGLLGYGDGATRGDGGNEMGDSLAVVDLGSGFLVHSVSDPVFGKHNCVWLRNDSQFYGLKCFGVGSNGRLGYGDTGHRGDEANEMGDYLPVIISYSGTCPEEDRNVVNWHNLLNDAESSSTSLLKSSSVTFDPSTLSLTFKAMVHYVGESADGNFDDDFNLGTSYWVDFESFSNVDGIGSAGSCTNRRSSDYEDLTFGEMWSYTANPADLQSVSTAERMAYPPSNWTLTAANCTVIEFEQTFSWTELSSCADAAGNALIAVTQSADWVELTGTFYVELVSPYSMGSNGYYRTFPVVQQAFGIVLSRTVNVLASTGVQLFIPSVMAYGRDAAGNYQVTVLVQSADYVQLGMDDVNAIQSPLAVTAIETVTGTECLSASSFTCGQIFTATIPAQCSDPNSIVDLGGNYQFSFTPQCRENHEPAEACSVFLSTLDESSGKVVLDVDATFTDDCDADLFDVSFGGELTFYSNDAFAVAIDNNSDPFVIGQDTIFGKVTVNIPSDPSGDMYRFVNVSIENVYVCTAASALTVDSDTGLGGCWSSDGVVDADGPYTVIGSGAVAAYQGSTEYEVSGINEAAFSFLTFDTPRERITVHVQLLLTMVTDTGSERRRMLLQSDGSGDEGNAFQSYVESVAVKQAEEGVDGNAGPDGTDDVGAVNGGVMAMVFAVIALFVE